MKKLNLQLFFFALFIAVPMSNCFAQNNTVMLSDLQANFNTYKTNNLQEKLYIHTDKSAYTTGELLWLKVYNVDGATHKPVDLSKVVYVEVLDNKQNPVVQAKIAMIDGAGSGSIFLPISLTTGNYLLRAYTSWMKNFSPDYYYYKKLTIINPLKSPVVQNKGATVNYDVQFFPEGGNLVNGLTSIVGFKATDQYGNGVNFKGLIIDKNNDTVARFEPFKFGIGHFAFKPDSHNTYKAVIKLNGKIIQEDLPLINETGDVMTVKDNRNGQVEVTVNSNMPAENIYLFVHSRGVIKAVESASVDNGKAFFMVNKNTLGDGISQFTIFNSKQQPLCERVFFKRPAQQLMIDAATDQQQYLTRKKVTIAINAKIHTNPAVTGLSLSVYRLDSLQHADKEDISNYLWLSSDLKGNIESPDFYFKNNDEIADEAADNLMLTQGWRRFDWAAIIKNKKPAFKFLPEYNGPIISATITNTATNNPQSGIIAYLGIPGKRVQFYSSESDTTGGLTFNMKNFYGPGEIVVQTNTLRDSTYRIDVLNPFSEQYAKIQLPDFKINETMQSLLENNNLSVQIQNTYNAEKLRQFYNPNIDSTAFFGQPYKTYLLDNYTRFLTIEEVMREYVSEVNIVHPHNHFHIRVLNRNSVLDEGDPLVLIDGVPFFDIDKLFALDPLKVRKLDDMPFVYLFGPSYNSGIFSFTTYKGDLGGAELDPHAVVLDYEGLQLQREFYSPVYDTDEAAQSRIPDFRNVLYWAPYVNTDLKGKNTLSFYTSDETGKYIGVIQGLTDNGETGSQTFSFDVVNK